MKDKLREEIFKYLYADGFKMNKGDAERSSDYIIFLIDAQRCVWTNTHGDYDTSCGAVYEYQTSFQYCPCCGLKIEVKDA